LWSIVMTRSSGKKSILQSFLHSFFYYRFVAHVIHYFVHSARVPGARTSIPLEDPMGLDAWSLHFFCFVAVQFCPQDLVFSLLTNDWVWPLVQVVAQLNITAGVYSATANAERQDPGSPIYPFIIGLAVFYGPCLVRRETAGNKREALAVALAYLLPQVAVDVYTDNTCISSGNGLRHPVGKACIAIQIIAVLTGSNYLPFIEKSLGSYVWGALDAVLSIVPTAHGGKAAKPKSPAKKAKSPAKKR